ncbi:MAG: hypothetical protein ACYTFY_10270 [Planctomycetota bacterium]|jgi:hypothetical protein
MKALKYFTIIMFMAIAMNFVSADELTDEEKEEVVWIKGTVVVIKDDAGKISQGLFKTIDIDENDNEIKVAYRIVLNKKGMEVVQKYNGKELEMAVYVFKKGNINYIKISEYEEVNNDDEPEEDD